MRARASMAALLAATVLVGGCGGGDEPEAEPTPILPSSSSPSSPSTSESEAAEETAPEMPEAAREESLAGSRAFIEHWADLVTYMLNTGDTGPIDALAVPGCESCEGTSDQVSTIYEAGGRIESKGWSVKQLGFNQNTIASEPVARFIQGRERVWADGDANKPEVNPRSELTLTFVLQRKNGEWRIEQYAVAE